jgi:methylthioribulose-1-phosphate dehydratase
LFERKQERILLRYRRGDEIEKGRVLVSSIVKIETPEAHGRVATLLSLMVPAMVDLEREAEALCATARWCYARGWVPATSGNFSVRDRGAARMLISPSGLDKGVMTRGDLLETDLAGRAADPGKRPSAETALHAVIYRERPDAYAILHVHTVWNTIVSGSLAERGHVPLQGYELLKGLAGVTTHEYEERVPILENLQDYVRLAEDLATALKQYTNAHGVLLSRHGLYTWGSSVAESRRHLEALEFLFEVEGRRGLGGRA